MWKLTIPLPTYEEWHFIEYTWSLEGGVKVRDHSDACYTVTHQGIDYLDFSSNHQQFNMEASLLLPELKEF